MSAMKRAAAPMTLHKQMDMSSKASLLLLPLGMMSSPGSAIATVADMGVSVVLPLHMGIGLKYVIEDYAPPAYKKAMVYSAYAVSGITAAGLLSLSLDKESPGVCGSLKRLWKA